MSAVKSDDGRRKRAGLRRSWPQRLSVAATFLTAFACFVGAGGLATAHWLASQRQVVTLDGPSDEVRDAVGDITTIDGSSPSAGDEAAFEQIELAEPDAANFLLTGADTGTCDSQAGDPGIGLRTDEGRSDTIMLWRVNPDTDELAVLSFPRDLYVDRPGGFRSKINAAYRQNDPSELVDTLYLNFGVPVDHYIQVDFCAFKTLVDAVGGVDLDFEAAVHDSNTGFTVDPPGCVTLNGDAALSYVRARKLRVYDPETESWSSDPTGDLGRISRQQDFARKLIAKVVDEGLYSPSTASGLIETNREYLVTDSGLSINRMLEFANVLSDVDTGEIGSYQIESYSDWVGNESVQRVSIDNDNMQQILRIFRGQASLSDAPEQDIDPAINGSTTATSVADSIASDDSVAPSTEVNTGDADNGDDAAAETAPSTTVFDGLQETIGIVPVSDDACS